LLSDGDRFRAAIGEENMSSAAFEVFGYMTEIDNSRMMDTTELLFWQYVFIDTNIL
jgi:hypothetical protein